VPNRWTSGEAWQPRYAETATEALTPLTIDSANTKAGKSSGGDHSELGFPRPEPRDLP